MSNPNAQPTALGSEPAQDMIYFDGAGHPTVTYLSDPIDMSEELLGDFGEDRDATLFWQRALKIRARNRVLGMRSVEVGADWGRVRSFMASLGAPVKAMRVLGPDDFNTAVSMEGPWDDQEVEKYGGIYLPRTDVALVKYDSPVGRLNGAFGYERYAVHELAHAWRTTKYIKSGGKDWPIGGFMLGGERDSHSLEEAWACLIEGRYASDARGSHAYPPEASGLHERARKYMYIMKSGEGNAKRAVMPHGAYGAMILERMAERDPTFFALLCNARTEPSRLEEVRERMNAVLPNLYEQLNDINVDSADGKQRLVSLEQQVAYSLLSRASKIAHLVKWCATGDGYVS